MKIYEENYFGLLKYVLEHGQERPSRVGTTKSIFGGHLVIDDLRLDCFPLLMTRKMHTAGQLGELAAFIRGATDLGTFQKFGCNFWNENAKQWERNWIRHPRDWLVGHIYGYQWRNWHGHYDQLNVLTDSIVNDPFGRRHLLTTWDPADLENMCLPPCHILTQFYVNTDGTLDCQVYMRSVDLCLGLPSDVVLYSALLTLVAKRTGYLPGSVRFSFGDTHIYTKHIPQLLDQLKRTPRLGPAYKLNIDSSLFTFMPEDFEFIDYTPDERIAYELLV
jgi:thymidylate synthase